MSARTWLVLAAAAVACQDPSAPEPTPTGQVVVLVSWQDRGVPGKRVELVEIGETRLTDANGVAVFTVPVGDYVLRAYDINQGGPARLSLDFKAVVRENATTRIEVWDCPVCDGPAPGG